MLWVLPLCFDHYLTYLADGGVTRAKDLSHSQGKGQSGEYTPGQTTQSLHKDTLNLSCRRGNSFKDISTTGSCQSTGYQLLGCSFSKSAGWHLCPSETQITKHFTALASPLRSRGTQNKPCGAGDLWFSHTDHGQAQTDTEDLSLRGEMPCYLLINST